MQKAYNELDRFFWNENEMLLYDMEKKRVLDNASALDSAYDKGLQEGKDEAMQQVVSNIGK